MDNGSEKPVQHLETEDEYVTFPGGIPKRWLNPAFYLFISVFIGYATWVIIGEIREAGKVDTSLLVTAKSIFTHLAAFIFVFIVIITVFCKVLERLMYYLEAKKHRKLAEQRAEKAEQRAEQERQRAELAEQRAEQVEAENARLLKELEKYKQNQH